eukprot:TRINITY_DN66601_c9_g5_i1.p1 TRINITY_DN66601_c9_g5~~TRINITY_DN66601_c9_g5_i1.p1  ORF type:complete len:393 (-),score=2.55 TRINITY_DN66601_c9_g5_i1:146-1324(-)
MFVSVTLLLSFIVTIQAGCDNACSGHGTCTEDGVCKCFDNWGLGLSHDSGDCSDRICPFDISWVDNPDSVGTRHNYAECSSRGICDRSTGMCDCFPGYEGKACQRSTCPNDCSGHGQCAYIENLPYQSTPFDWYNNYYPSSDLLKDFLPQSPKTFETTYYGWDKKKTRGCVCDPEWGDVDCSKRLCPYGTDIMDHRPDVTDTRVYHKQEIQFQLNSATNTAQDGNTFALTFKSQTNETFTTTPIVFNHCNFAECLSNYTEYVELARDIKTTLEALPNRVIDTVNVEVISTNKVVTITIEFVGDHVQGKQNMLTMRNYKCDAGCTPKLSGLELVPGTLHIDTITTADAVNGAVTADHNSYECGRRGKCNYDTGVCQCFAGYTGLACNTITALV